MSRDFILPDLGEGLTEAEIVAWLVAPGDEVAIDQPVVELESAKSVVQLPTPFAGVVESLGGEIGQVLHAGETLMTLAPAAASPADQEADAPDTGDAESPVDAAPPVQSAEPGIAVPTDIATEESGAVLIGYGTRATTATKRADSAPARFGRRGPASAKSPVNAG
ncbi:MAG TPA: biotin/lipoyl-containing protein, partial [Agromyces sp.]